MRVVNVAVGSPAAFVASDVESDSHAGNSWVGAVMRGGRTSTSVSRADVGGTGIGAAVVRCGENVYSSSQVADQTEINEAASRLAERKKKES